MFKSLERIFFGLDSTSTSGFDDLPNEVKKRAQYLLPPDRYEMACFLCEKLNIAKPDGHDVIWQTEQRIIDEMRAQNWTDAPNAEITG